MNYTKLLFLTGVLLLCVAPVLGWTVDSTDHSVTVEFKADNTGHLNIDGYSLNFNWVWAGPCDNDNVNCGRFKASYLWYSVDLISDGKTVTSPQFPGARLVR